MDRNGKWSLSPAYDVGYNYNPGGGWTARHQMSVQGKFEGILRRDLLSLADANGIKAAERTIDEVVDACSQWPSTAEGCGVPSEMIASRFENFEMLRH